MIDWNGLAKQIREWLADKGATYIMGWLVPKLGKFWGFFTPAINWIVNLFSAKAAQKVDEVIYDTIKDADNEYDGTKYGEAKDRLENLPPDASDEDRKKAEQDVKDAFDHLTDSTGR